MADCSLYRWFEVLEMLSRVGLAEHLVRSRGQWYGWRLVLAIRWYSQWWKHSQRRLYHIYWHVWLDLPCHWPHQQYWLNLSVGATLPPVDYGFVQRAKADVDILVTNFFPIFIPFLLDVFIDILSPRPNNIVLIQGRFISKGILYKIEVSSSFNFWLHVICKNEALS